MEDARGVAPQPDALACFSYVRLSRAKPELYVVAEKLFVKEGFISSENLPRRNASHLIFDAGQELFQRSRPDVLRYSEWLAE